MNECNALNIGDEMLPLDKLSYWMEYFCNCLPDKPKITFEEYCRYDSGRGINVGDDWETNLFASKRWVVLDAGYLYHAIYHNLKLKK